MLFLPATVITLRTNLGKCGALFVEDVQYLGYTRGETYRVEKL